MGLTSHTGPGPAPAHRPVGGRVPAEPACGWPGWYIAVWGTGHGARGGARSSQRAGNGFLTKGHTPCGRATRPRAGRSISLREKIQRQGVTQASSGSALSILSCGGMGESPARGRERPNSIPRNERPRGATHPRAGTRTRAGTEAGTGLLHQVEQVRCAGVKYPHGPVHLTKSCREHGSQTASQPPSASGGG